MQKIDCYTCKQETNFKRKYNEEQDGGLEAWLKLLDQYGEHHEEWWQDISQINFPVEVMRKLRRVYLMKVYYNAAKEYRAKFPEGKKGNIEEGGTYFGKAEQTFSKQERRWIDKVYIQEEAITKVDGKWHLAEDRRQWIQR